MKFDLVRLGEILTESKVESINPNPDKRIRVKLNVAGVEKRPLEGEISGATKQYIRKSGQFIYGKQNFHKGAFGIVPEELDGYETSADIPSFDIIDDCLPDWIYYYFKAGDRYKELEILARGAGSKRIHFKQIFELKIPLPSIEDQRRIIARLKMLEGKLAVLNKNIKEDSPLVLQLRQTILQEAIQGKLTAQWRKENPDVEPASELLKQIKAEKEKLLAEGKIRKEKPLPPVKPEEIPFELPEGWVWCRLRDLGTITGGGTPSKNNPNYWNGEIPWITPKDMKSERIKNSIDRITEEGVKNSSAKLIPINSIIIVGRSGILKRKVPVAINEIECTVNQDMKVLIPYFSDQSIFIHYLISGFQNHILRKFVKFGMTVHSLIYKDFENMPVPLPPLDEQTVIKEKLEATLLEIDALECENQEILSQIDYFRQSFLNDAFKMD